jgi:hypothetical protein
MADNIRGESPTDSSTILGMLGFGREGVLTDPEMTTPRANQASSALNRNLQNQVQRTLKVRRT